MKLKHLENLITVDEDITDDKFGTYYDKRSVEQLLNYGLIPVSYTHLTLPTILLV